MTEEYTQSLYHKEEHKTSDTYTYLESRQMNEEHSRHHTYSSMYYLDKANYDTAPTQQPITSDMNDVPTTVNTFPPPQIIDLSSSGIEPSTLSTKTEHN